MYTPEASQVMGLHCTSGKWHLL